MTQTAEFPPVSDGYTSRTRMPYLTMGEPTWKAIRQLADVAPAQLLDWIAWALRFSAATVAAEQKGRRARPMKNGFVIVDRERTRC